MSSAMEVDNSTQPGLEPVQHPHNYNNAKPENSSYATYGGGPPSHTGPPYGAQGASPQHSYASPQNSYNTPTTAYGNGSADPYAVAADAKEGKPKRRICGLAAATFALLVALIVCIIAAAVGGGVGGTIAVNNAKTACLSDSAITMSSLSAALASATAGTTRSSSTAGTSAKTSATTSAATSAKTSAVVASSTQPWGAVGTDLGLSLCPDKEGQIYTSTTGTVKFKIFCDGDQPGFDLLQLLVTTMGLCMEACANWNLSVDTKTKCKGIAYVPSNIDGDSTGKPIDCYLKSVANATALTPNTYVVDYGIIQ